MSSHHLAKIELDDFELIGYSVAGEETVIGMPRLDVCFDIGKAPDQIIPINHLLLTHGHMDHAAGVAYYLSHRLFCDLPPGTVLAPPSAIEPIRQILDAWGRLDGNRIPANLVAVRPGDEFQIKPNLVARVFDTKHTRDSVGFTVIEKRKKLKAEYLSLSGPQLVELKKQGVVIDNPVEVPFVSYLGDTAYVDYSRLEEVSNSKILIAECTFFSDEHTGKASAGRHMHIDEFVPLLERMNNEYIILMHLTLRSTIGMAKKMLRERLSPATYRKVKILMDRKYRQTPGQEIPAKGLPS